MIRKMTLYIIVFAVFEIIIIINGNLDPFHSDHEITYKALKEVAEMHRRVRRQNILSPQNRQSVTKFQPRKMWKKGIGKVIVLNIMRNPKLYQGDVIMQDHQAKKYVYDNRNNLVQKGYRIRRSNFDNYTREKRKAITDLNYKWNMPIKFYIDPKVNEKNLMIALTNIQQETCIQFQRVNQPIQDSHGLLYQYGSGCSSYIGKQPTQKFQQVNLGLNCDKVGTAAHETFHALGLKHEQARSDRDDYLDIFLNNAQRGLEKNFEKAKENEYINYGIKYDYFSIMHYPKILFSKNGQPTTLPKARQYTDTMGQADEIAFVDYKIINFLYCSNRCTYKIQCANQGYQDPNNCYQCKCPTGFGGRQCTSFAPLPGECGTTQFTASNKIQAINISGQKNCIFRITVSEGMRIAYKLTNIVVCIYYDYSCVPSDSVSIRYFKDQSISGARYCTEPMGKVHISHGSSVILEYFSGCKDMSALFLFKAVRIDK